MSLPAFATQSVTVLRPGWVTDHGAEVRDWETATSHVVAGCSVQPGTGSDDQANRVESVTTVLTVFAPADADLQDTDRVIYDGTAYDIEGPVRRFTTSVLDHIEASLRYVAG